MQWLLYLPALAAPAAVLAAYLILKASARQLRKRIAAAPAAPVLADNPFGDIIVDGAPEHGGTINVTFHKEHA